MKNLRLLLFFICIAPTILAQSLHIGVFGGLSAYNGDLTENIFPKKVTNGAIGITLNYEMTEKIMLRGGFTYSIVGGADRFSKDSGLIKRNLAFETRIFEFSIVGEYYLFNLYDRHYSPYVFAGLAAYHFDPYAYDVNKQKVYLKPLSTEGQGISGYPDRKPYSLTQMAIPFGGGIKFAINDDLRVGIELGMRKLFTDYFDDVSKNFIDVNDLLTAKGQLAVDMSYRGDELPGGDPNYPQKNAQRGSPKSKDYYYFAGIHITYRFGAGNDGTGSGRKSRMGCPMNPL